MSYSLSIPARPIDAAPLAIGDLAAAVSPQDPPTEVLDHLAAIAAALPGLVAALGPDLGGGYTVTASGHAEPGHGYRPGWGTDGFHMSIAKAGPPKDA